MDCPFIYVCTDTWRKFKEEEDKQKDLSKIRSCEDGIKEVVKYLTLNSWTAFALLSLLPTLTLCHPRLTQILLPEEHTHPHSHSHNVHVVQNQMLAAGSLKISYITMSQFSLYEYEIPEFFLRPCFIFFPEALRSVIFLALLKNAHLLKKVSEYMLFEYSTIRKYEFKAINIIIIKGNDVCNFSKHPLYVKRKNKG